MRRFKVLKIFLFTVGIMGLLLPSLNAEAFGIRGSMPAEPEPPMAPEVVSADNNNTGTADVKFTLSEGGADGYEFEYTANKEFAGKPKTIDVDRDQVLLTIDKLSQDRTYYMRFRGYRINYRGKRIYGDYSELKTLDVKDGLPDVEPESDSAEILSLAISGGTVTCDAEVPLRVRSSDDNYYLVRLHPESHAVLGEVASCEKDTTACLSFAYSYSGLMYPYQVAVLADDGSYTPISAPLYIDNPEAVAGNQNAYPTPLSKKGRQGIYDTSAGDKHYFHNFYLETIIGNSSSYDVAYNYNGSTYYFYYPTHYINYDQDIRVANKDGGTVTMQIMLRYSGNATDLITPSGRTPGYNYYAMNVEEDSAREKLTAAFSFLAEYWSQPGLHVDNWILGNEVNTFLNTTGRWYWAGRISRDAFMTNYSETFRILYYAVKAHYANARVFTCTDHTWNDRDNDWGTMGFITALDSYLEKKNPKINWNLANHAYTAVLTNSDFWNDGKVRIYSVAHSTGASFVSPYNLEVLTNYVKNNFGSETRIILSEVGFSSTGGTNPTLNGGRQAGEGVQAVATAWLFYKGQFTDNIDSVIFHTGDEGEPGKNFSLYGKPAWNVYLYMDTPSYYDYTVPYLPVCGASSWESIVSGFSAATLQKMPNR